MQKLRSHIASRKARAGAAIAVATVAIGNCLVAGAGATGESETFSLTELGSSVKDEISSNLSVILGTAGAILALTIGYRLFRRFAK